MADKSDKGDNGATSRPAQPPAARKGMIWQFVSLGILFLFISNRALLAATGKYAGYVLNPAIGFGGKYPVLTLLIAGSITVLLTTVLRHFTTDWLQMAKFQSYQRAYMKEMREAQKDNNTFKLKRLQEKQADIQAKSMELQSKQMMLMPLSSLIAIPIYAWMTTFLTALPYWHFSAPWNLSVDMFGNDGIVPWFGGRRTSVLAHWYLLIFALTFPLSSLIQRSMKYLSWRERWARRHPEVHEA